MADLLVIDDATDPDIYMHPIVDGEQKVCGTYGFQPLNFGSEVPMFEEQERIPLIPQSEWDDRIDELERNNATLWDLVKDSGLEVLNQNGTSYCWINSVAYCGMIIRLKESGQLIRLSPASAGAPIKNFVNRGGWMIDGLNYMVRHGMNEQSDWPANAIRRQYYTEENKQKARKNRVVEYYKLSNWEQVVSSVLAGFPVAAGWSWWYHSTAIIHITKRTHDAVIANSWGTGWSQNGFGILKGSKKYPSGGSVAICSMVAI